MTHNVLSQGRNKHIVLITHLVNLETDLAKILFLKRCSKFNFIHFYFHGENLILPLIWLNYSKTAAQI